MISGRADGTGPPLIYRGHGDKVFKATYSPDGRRVVTASVDQTAHVWNADGTGQPVILRGHTAPVNTARFSPDGARIATTSNDTTVRIFAADGSVPRRTVRDDVPAPLEVLDFTDQANPAEYYAEYGKDFLAPRPVRTESAKSEVHFLPLGTVFGVMPWNFPMWQVMRFAVALIPLSAWRARATTVVIMTPVTSRDSNSP